VTGYLTPAPSFLWQVAACFGKTGHLGWTHQPVEHAPVECGKPRSLPHVDVSADGQHVSHKLRTAHRSGIHGVISFRRSPVPWQIRCEKRIPGKAFLPHCIAKTRPDDPKPPGVIVEGCSLAVQATCQCVEDFYYNLVIVECAYRQ
jgi:hypothetical protein